MTDSARKAEAGGIGRPVEEVQEPRRGQRARALLVGTREPSLVALDHLEGMAAQQLSVGLVQPNPIALADVAAVGEREIAAEQREGQGVSPDLAARRAQLGVILADGRRAGMRDTQPVEQPRAVRLIEVAEVAGEHPTRGVIRGALVFREVADRLSGGDDANPRLAGAGERPQERLHTGGTQLAAQRPRRMLERFETVEDEQGAAPGDRLGQEPALVPGRDRGVVLDPEPAQRLVEEGIVRGLAVVASSLAKEAPAVDTPRPCQPSDLIRSSQRLTRVVFPTPPGATSTTTCVRPPSAQASSRSLSSASRPRKLEPDWGSLLRSTLVASGGACR